MNAASKRIELYGFAERLRNQQHELAGLKTPEATVRHDGFLDSYEPIRFPELKLEQPEPPKLPKAVEAGGLLSSLWNRFFQ
ncbi:MAG TPA: hypothetical protein EYO33_13525 [Phycisphaerales bacterium]|nr:hypothetical protein [Phycisphaerales bacterium]